MAATKIFDLTATTTLAATDVLPLVDVSDTAQSANGSTRKITLATLQTYLESVGKPRVRTVASTHTVSTTACTKVTDLDTTLEIGTYTFDYYIRARSATVTVSPMFNVNVSTGTAVGNWWFEYADLSATLLAAIGTAAHAQTTALGFAMRQAEATFATSAAGRMGITGSANAVQTTATNILYKITGLLTVTVAGTLELWHGSETATSTSVEVGTSLLVLRTA